MDRRQRLLAALLALTAAGAAAVVTSCISAPGSTPAQQPQQVVPDNAAVIVETPMRGGRMLLWTDPAENSCWHLTVLPKSGAANTVRTCGDGTTPQATRLYGVIVVLGGCETGEALVRTAPDAEPVRYVARDSLFLMTQPVSGEIGESFDLACAATPATFRPILVTGA
ncbi:hypothetical protein [Catellatospora tritici]|uniref:hypothetical protein n=1 Tax=Catellatospora tritici TaxID=2851566 RepID=UPI001C2D265F|nr:hypothetical protein [Catellatospora tritici]MBV1851560.1 hypothetical protein [Catellatospora tritici]